MYKAFKRLCDILISAVGLIILSPVFLIIVLLIKFKLGKGPILFKQARVGKGGLLFNLYKFRTMLHLFDENGILLPDSKRHTKFGKLLRATSLDELPQLWNILKGDMSLIGPRPKVPKDMMLFTKYYYGDNVRPGITGYSQAYSRNNISWTQRLKDDNYYVDNFSFWLDVKIFFKTIATVFARENIEKEQYFYYADELLDKKLITENEYKTIQLKARELETRCKMGEKLRMEDFGLNLTRDMPVVSDVQKYNDKSA